MLMVAIPLTPLRQSVLCREFGVCDESTLRYHASCALKDGALLLQGRLFVFSQQMAFYSCVFGYTTRKAIQFASVAAVERAGLARSGVFGAIRIKLHDGDSLVFASFWNRTAAMSEIKAAWQEATSSEARDEARIASSSQPPPDEEEEVASAADAASEPGTPDSADTWAPSPTSSGGTADEFCTEEDLHGDFTQLILAEGEDGMRISLPCGVDDTFRLLFASTSCFLEAWRGGRGEFDITVAPWVPSADEPGVLEREVFFRAPLEAMKGQVSGRMPTFGIPQATRIREMQRAIRCGSSLRVDSSSRQLDIPYGESFVLETRLLLSAAPDGGCVASASARTRWVQRVRLGFVKRMIEQKSLEGAGESFRGMLGYAQSFLRRSVDPSPPLPTEAPMTTDTQLVTTELPPPPMTVPPPPPMELAEPRSTRQESAAPPPKPADEPAEDEECPVVPCAASLHAAWLLLGLLLVALAAVVQWALAMLAGTFFLVLR